MDGSNARRTVEEAGAVFEAKFVLPWPFAEEAAVAARSAVLSIITGGGKWVEIKVHADPLYQHLLLTAERKFWRCVQTSDRPALFGVETPRPRLEAVRIVDMSSSNHWAALAACYARTRAAHGEHESAKAELKKLVRRMPRKRRDMASEQSVRSPPPSALKLSRRRAPIGQVKASERSQRR